MLDGKTLFENGTIKVIESVQGERVLTVIKCVHDGQETKSPDLFYSLSQSTILFLCNRCTSEIRVAYLEELFKSAIKQSPR